MVIDLKYVTFSSSSSEYQILEINEPRYAHFRPCLKPFYPAWAGYGLEGLDELRRRCWMSSEDPRPTLQECDGFNLGICRGL